MRKILAATAVAVLLTTPVTVVAKPKPTGLELQQIQSRDFEGSYDNLFRSVVSVLQDAGYRIQSADKDSGLITGSASTKSGMSYSFFGGWGKKKKTPVVSAVIEERGPNISRVRLSFVMAKTKSSLYGMSSSDEKPIMDAAVYQDAFEKIGQAMFMRQATDSTTPAVAATSVEPVATPAVEPAATPAAEQASTTSPQ